MMNHGGSNGNQFEVHRYASQMPMARPFSIHIFCPDGDSVGLKEKKKSQTAKNPNPIGQVAA